jgi:hypothetical protein
MSTINHDESLNRSGAEQNMSSPQESPESWAETSGSPGVEPNRDQSYMPGAQRHPSSFNAQDANVSYGTSIPLVALYSQHDIQLQTPMSPEQPELDLSHSLPPPPNMSSPKIREDGPVFGTSISLVPGRPLLDGPETTLQSLSTSGNTNDVHSLSRTWYQNNFSSINWLPDNWTPDFEMEDGNNLELIHQSQYPGPGQITQTNATKYSHVRLNSGLSMPTTQDQIGRQRQVSLSESQVVDAQKIPSPGSQSTHSAGQYYVDGEGARLPRVRKSPYQVSDSFIPMSPYEGQELREGFMFSIRDESQDNLTASNAEEIPQSIYNEIVRVFNLTCISSTHYAPFQSGTFPSSRVLSHYVRLYIQNFQPILPFIHPATFDLLSSHWLLVLAVAAIGNHFIESEEMELHTVAMHEFTRRAIQTVVSQLILKRLDCKMCPIFQGADDI